MCEQTNPEELRKSNPEEGKTLKENLPGDIRTEEGKKAAADSLSNSCASNPDIRAKGIGHVPVPGTGSGSGTSTTAPEKK